MSALRQGYALGLTAYGLWGLFPLFFKLLAALPATEILFQRILWSALFSALLLLVWRHRGWWAELRAHPRPLLWLAVSGALVACNWLVYIWAVNNAHVVEASLGYYINPLVNILLALVILGERLRPLQWIAVGLAVLGVAQQLWTLGQLPWVSLALALSFAFYGLVRRQTPVAALPGMVVESWMLVPIALVALPLLTPGVSLQAETWQSSLGLLIVLAGPVTLIPLLCFNAAARKLPYSTLGFLQYLAPTLVLIQAVWLYGEPFPRERLFAFICIWTGLAVFSFDLWRASRKLRACSKARELETNKAKGPEEAEFTRGK